MCIHVHACCACHVCTHTHVDVMMGCTYTFLGMVVKGGIVRLKCARLTIPNVPKLPFPPYPNLRSRTQDPMGETQQRTMGTASMERSWGYQGPPTDQPDTAPGFIEGRPFSG